MEPLKQGDVTAEDIHDLEPARVSVVHSFDLFEEPPIHSKVHKIPPKHNVVVKEDI